MPLASPLQALWQPAARADSTDNTVPIAGLAVEIVSRAHEGLRRFEIRLDPPELGRIDVRLDVDRGGNVTSRLTVERAETLDLLRRDAPQLERALQHAGLNTEGGLQFSLRDQNFANREQTRPERRDLHRSGRRAGGCRSRPARLRPAHRAGRRRRHQGVRTSHG